MLAVRATTALHNRTLGIIRRAVKNTIHLRGPCLRSTLIYRMPIPTISTIPWMHSKIINTELIIQQRVLKIQRCFSRTATSLTPTRLIRLLSYLLCPR